MVAIGVGAAALILVLSVFNGFEGLVKGLYADFYADVRIAPAEGKFISINTAQWQSIQSTKGLQAMSGVVEEKAVLTNGDCSSIVYIRGVDSTYTAVSKLNTHIRKGKFARGSAEQPSLLGRCRH